MDLLRIPVFVGFFFCLLNFFTILIFKYFKFFLVKFLHWLPTVIRMKSKSLKVMSVKPSSEMLESDSDSCLSSLFLN